MWNLFTLNNISRKKNYWNDQRRWMENTAYFIKNQIPCSNVLKVPEFFFCLPDTNAAIERVFSIMNSFWTSDKTQL